MGYIKCKNCKNSQYSTDEDGNKLHWCPIFADSKDMEGDRICTRFEPQSQADRIRAMSDEELAEFLVDHHRYPCKYCLSCWTVRESDEGGCKEELMRWLKLEAKEEK